ncbi:MAG: hypothetical protein FJ035_03715 [Chloroflexi bacterium]|nr:hypothetical protein [Chloroflexota bacterium]
MLHPTSAAVFAGSWGMLGWMFVQLGVGIAGLAAHLASQGNAWAPLLVLAAAASIFIALASVRRVAGALQRARHR